MDINHTLKWFLEAQKGGILPTWWDLLGLGALCGLALSLATCAMYENMQIPTMPTLVDSMLLLSYVGVIALFSHMGRIHDLGICQLYYVAPKQS